MDSDIYVELHKRLREEHAERLALGARGWGATGEQDGDELTLFNTLRRAEDALTSFQIRKTGLCTGHEEASPYASAAHAGQHLGCGFYGQTADSPALSGLSTLAAVSPGNYDFFPHRTATLFLVDTETQNRLVDKTVQAWQRVLAERKSDADPHTGGDDLSSGEITLPAEVLSRGHGTLAMLIQADSVRLTDVRYRRRLIVQIKS